jgi:hypothetical protein
MGASSSKILDLRNLLAERYPQTRIPSQPRMVTGLAAFDQATDGGLPKGGITELTSPEVSAGSALLIWRLLHAAQRQRTFLTLIDGRDSFDASGLENLVLRHLLWIRCRKTLEAVKAADLLLRDGNFPLVILDLVLNAPEELRKIPQSSWYRLQRLVEPTSTALLVLTRRSMISSAQLKLVLDNRWRLPDLQAAENFARLQFQVQRMHGGRQMAMGAG